MALDPVPRDVHPPADPHPVALLHVVEKTAQSGEASGPPDQTTVQSDGHHLGPRVALGVEHLEGVPQVLEELLADS